MERWIMEHDYTIIIYKKEDIDSYNTAIKVLNETKRVNGWDRIFGVTINKDCRIPSIYHGDDLAIIMECDNGNGNYNIIMG